MLEIKDGAFVISDAHYSKKRPQLLNFFKDIQAKKYKPTQLILMGDILDVLIGSVGQTINKNKEIVDLLDDISKDIETIYLEGNHDFNLKHIFKNINIFKLSQQPVKCVADGKKIYLAHGDFDGPFGYKVYTFFIRNSVVLFILNAINYFFNNTILKRLDLFLDRKDDCKKIKNFEDIVKNRIEKKYDCDYFIEGHFHQDRFINLKNFNYINVGAFACNQRYFVVKFANKELLLGDKYLGD